MATFVFDFDGTLADSLEAIVDVFNKESKNQQITVAELRNLSTHEIIKKFNISILRLPRLLHHIRTELEDKITSHPPHGQFSSVLTTLKNSGHGIGILTSNSANNVNTYIKHYTLPEFDFIYGSISLFKKSHALNKLLKRHSLAKTEVIYVGDETRDITAAKQCGIRSVAVTWGLHTKELLQTFAPDYLIDQPEALLEITL